MKNNIFSIVSSFAALLFAAAIPAFADDAETIQADKSATFDYDTRSGVITLEQFVPGAINIEREAKPIDVVLVLDYSGSMNDSYDTQTSYTRVVTDTRYSWLHFGGDSDGETNGKQATACKREFANNSHDVYANYNGTNYQLYIIRKSGTQNAGSDKTVYRHWCYITVGTDRIYVTPDGGFIKAANANNPGFDNANWPVDTDGEKIPPTQDGDGRYRQIFCTYTTASGSTTSKYYALEKSVYSFIELIKTHSGNTGFTDRIAIASFQGSSDFNKGYANLLHISDSRNTETYYLGEGQDNYLIESTEDYGFNNSTYTWTSTDARVHQKARVLKRFIDVSSFNAVNILKHSLTSLDHVGNTPTNLGTKIGMTMMEKWGRISQTVNGKTLNVARYIIVFSDGQPTDQTSTSSYDTKSSSAGSGDGTGKEAVVNMYSSKNSKERPCIVYTVYCPSSTDAKTTNGSRFMARLSSDHPTAQSSFDGTDVTPAHYAKEASNNLESVFDDVSQEIVVQVNEKYDDNTILTDCINGSGFCLPSSLTQANAYDKIKVYKVDCNSYTESSKAYGWSSTKTQLKQSDGITITVTKGTNDKVEVKGYNFSKNWCGINSETNTARGSKIIVEIPYEYNGAEVTGNINTNTSDSYVRIKNSSNNYVNDTQYKSPSKELSAVTVKRTNMNAGENAIYTIQKKNGDSYVNVGSVCLEGDSDGTDQRTLFGLAPGTYKVTENAWNWAYDKSTNPVEKSTSTTNYSLQFDFSGTHKTTTSKTSPVNTNLHDEGIKVNTITNVSTLPVSNN